MPLRRQVRADGDLAGKGERVQWAGILPSVQGNGAMMDDNTTLLAIVVSFCALAIGAAMWAAVFAILTFCMMAGG